MNRIRVKNDPALDTSVEALRRTINAQKVELASRNLRITGLEETLKEAAQFIYGVSIKAESGAVLAKIQRMLYRARSTDTGGK